MILEGNCLEKMMEIPMGSIDLIVTDLPYGVTRNKWDSEINLSLLWANYERVLKPNGVVVLFGQDKFSARLMLSNEKMHRYNLVWEKSNPTGHLNAKKRPMRSHEDMLVFYKGSPTYNPQKTQGHARKVSSIAHKRASKITSNYGAYHGTNYDSTERYPRSVWRYKKDVQKSALHPTQKPVALIEEIIRTYSNPGETVLDSCAGSGTTGVAAINTGRKYILIENNPEYIEIIKSRIKI